MNLLIGFPVLIFSAILHEVAHGYVAEKLGDPTARLAGRLTLDPRKHIDLYMTILLPLILFLSGSPVILGGAKPVPIDDFNLREGRKDLALVALAGPLTNIILAVIAAIILKIPFLTHSNSLIINLLSFILYNIVEYNLFLAIFNLLPIPPLDGSKLFAMLLPEKNAAAYLSIERFGTLIILFLLMFPVFGFSLSNFLFSLFNFAKNLLGI